MTVIGIPSTRVSDLFVRQRLNDQIQSDQLALFRAETQLATGTRFQLPSEDPIAAQRVINLQRLLEQKQQVGTNLTTNTSFLYATDSAMSQVSGVVSDIRGTVLGVIGTTATDTQRSAAAQQVQQAVQQLLNTGNQNFRGRYLFAGSETNVRPFELQGANIVRYYGNESRVATLGDLDLLIDTNLQGNEVFGAISDAVRGEINGNSTINTDTRLVDLFGGRGVSLGSIELVNVTAPIPNNSVINLSTAQTVGDVIALINAAPPPGSGVSAEITSTGIRVRLTTAGANLQINDVGTGTTARELGLATASPVGTAWVDGKAFDPKPLVVPVTYNTRLSDLFGGRGITKSSIQIADVTTTDRKTVIDLSAAETVGDLAAMLNANPPKNTAVPPDTTPILVEVTPTGIRVRSTTGSLQITDIGNGTTAKELGLTRTSGVGTNWLSSADFTPKMRETDLIGDILGYKARAVVRPPGVDSDMVITAAMNGYDMNGVTISFIDNGLPMDPTWNPTLKTLTINIQDNVTRAQDVVAAINAKHAVNPTALPFTAVVDPIEATLGGRGTLNHNSIAPVVTEFGAGEIFDQTSGVQINNGKTVTTIDISKATTIQDVLNTLNNSNAGVLAQINSLGTAIDVRSVLSGCDFAIGENGGTTASQLGLRTFNGTSNLTGLNFGRGVQDYQGPGVAASTIFEFAGSNNNLVFEAKANGQAWNGFNIRFNALPAPGPETVTWDPIGKTIDIGINPGVTTANQVIQAFTLAVGGPSSAFRVYLEPKDGTTGTGVVQVASQRTAGGEGDNADFIITRNDGVTFEIDINTATNIQGVIDLINTNATNTGTGTPLVARLAAYGNGIELVDNSIGTSGVYTTISRTKASTAAIDLGLIAKGATSQSRTQAGTISAAHVIATPAVANSAVLVQARGNGATLNGTQIQIVDTGAGPASVTYAGGVLTFNIASTALPVPIDTAAQMIALANATPAVSALFTFQLDPMQVPNDGSGVMTPTVTPFTMTGGTPDILTGRDVNPTETGGLFTAMLRLYDALQANDNWEVQRGIQILDEHFVTMNFARAELGSREQGIGLLAQRLQDEDVEIQTAISVDYDVDIARVVSDLSGRTVAYEASLRSMGQIMQMTLLNYLS